jgi:hypothetical protein
MMLPPDLVTFGQAKDIQAFSFVMPANDSMEPFLVTGGAESHVVILDGAHQWHGFAAENNTAWNGFAVSPCFIDVDLTSAERSDQSSYRPGSLLRVKDELWLNFMFRPRGGFEERRKVKLLGALPSGHADIGIIFNRWDLKTKVDEQDLTLRSLESKAVRF